MLVVLCFFLNMEVRGEEYMFGYFCSKLNKEGNKNVFMIKDYKF